MAADSWRTSDRLPWNLVRQGYFRVQLGRAPSGSRLVESKTNPLISSLSPFRFSGRRPGLQCVLSIIRILHAVARCHDTSPRVRSPGKEMIVLADSTHMVFVG